MTESQSPSGHRRMSGGPWQNQDQGHYPPDHQEEPAAYERLPPEERQHGSSVEGVANVVKTIVVHDERGQIISVTKVAPDAQFGVGVKPRLGQVVKEYEAGTLAEDPFSGPHKE
jgi:hypothetical protein